MAVEHNDGPRRFSIGHLSEHCGLYHLAVHPPATGEDWVGLSAAPLPIDAALTWAVTPECGGVVLFIGTVRDHAEGRPGVVGLEYEAYEEQAEARMAAVAAEARARFPGLGRVVLLHRTGALAVTETAVVVVASAPHRGEAFDGARFCIDTLKATVPIWKKETWADGSDWGVDAQEIRA
jgi:molybdopterin synthase catalytic subunit